MINLKFLKYGLVASIFCLLGMAKAYSAVWATVIVDQAIIYSDIEMSSEIGYIKKGKQVRVGEVPRNNGKLLPIIINQKVAYIQIQDIQTSTKLEALQSASKRMKELAKRSDKRPKRVALYGGTFLATGSAQTSKGDELDVEDSSDLTFLGFGIRDYRYREDGVEAGLKSGLDYYSATENETTFNFLTISANYFHHIDPMGSFDIMAYGGISISPFSELKNSDLYTLNGLGYGAQGGIEAILKIKEVYLHLDFGYQYLKLAGFDFSKISDDTDYEVDFTFSGPRAVAALSFFYQ